MTKNEFTFAIEMNKVQGLFPKISFAFGQDNYTKLYCIVLNEKHSGVPWGLFRPQVNMQLLRENAEQIKSKLSEFGAKFTHTVESGETITLNFYLDFEDEVETKDGTDGTEKT